MVRWRTRAPIVDHGAAMVTVARTWRGARRVRTRWSPCMVTVFRGYGVLPRAAPRWSPRRAGAPARGHTH